MKKMKLFLTLGLVLLASLLLIACTNLVPEVDEAAVVAEAKGLLTLQTTASENFSLTTTILVDEEHTVTVTWASDNTSVISISGANANVTRPAVGGSDASVKLTATLTFKEASDTKDFTVSVTVYPTDFQAVVDAAKDSFEIDEVEVTANFVLPVSFSFNHSNAAHAITVSWASDNAAIAISGGNATVNRPQPLEEDVDVTLTATLNVGGKSQTKTFEVVVKAQEAIAPTVEGLVYHWMPGAIGADVTATVDLHGASLESFKVLSGLDELEADIDFELASGTFTIFGATLDVLVDGLGDLTITFETEYGTTDFNFVVVDNPVGTSIPTQTVTGYNVSNIPSYTPTAPIAGAPVLLITEIGGDSGAYNFIEVFNNSNEAYNLKGHRIVYGDLTKQFTVAADLFQEPLGMAGGIYIYQDYIIPALGKAYLWVVSAYPWTVEATASVASEGRQIIEAADVASWVFGPNDTNLSLNKFKNRWNLAEAELVFPVRPQYMIHNNTSAYNATTGLGQPVAKGATSHWTDINSSTANRGIQIQKVDQETYYAVGDDTTGPLGSAFFRYEWVVTNKEEDVYVNGVIDRSKIEAYGTPNTTNYRESINGVGIRKVYFDADKVLLGYASAQSKQIDAYNINNANYMAMYLNSVTPIVTAMIYPNIVPGEAEGTLAAAKWGPYLSLEYTLPAEGSIVMRFIPRVSEPLYATFYADNAEALLTYKLSGIGLPVAGLFETAEVVVPVSSLYPTDYLSTGWNTIGRFAEYNFVPVQAA